MTRLADGKLPFIYIIVTTPMGDRVYSSRGVTMLNVVTELWDENNEEIWDENDEPILVAVADYSFAAISVEARVESFGPIIKELVSKKVDLLASHNRKRQQSMSFTLDNRDYELTKVMGQEPFINQKLVLRAGFEDTSSDEHLQLFSGAIRRIKAKESSVTIEAVEGEQMNLDETFTLTKAERYSNPLTDNDPLPLVYGDLTDGSQGVWKLPCIDTALFVYAFAAHEVMSVGQGNSITIYADGAEVDGADYAFDESEDYEGLGTIATITFTADQKNAEITARGKGKTGAGARLMEHIIVIIQDFLTVENSLSSAILNTASKDTAARKFVSQGYAAAGVVEKDDSYWNIITRMIGSFLGWVAQDTDGTLIFDIDDGSTPEISEIIPAAEIKVIDLDHRSENIVNRCPVNYRHNYADGEFSAGADEDAYADTVSISTYGTRNPEEPFEAFWIRALASVRAVQTVVVSRQKDPTWEITLDIVAPRWLILDPGDTVGLAINQLYDEEGVAFIKRIVKIVSWRPNLDTLTCRVTALDMKTDYMEYLLEPLLTGSGEPFLTGSGEPFMAEVYE